MPSKAQRVAFHPITFAPETAAAIQSYRARLRPCRADGFFYLIQLIPDVAPQRVKLGWAIDPKQRLAMHRCAAPTAKIVKTWPCNGRFIEKMAIRQVTREECVALSSEVFDCDDLERLSERIDGFFSGDLPERSARRVERDWLSRVDAAEFLGIPVYEFNDLIRAGSVPFTRLRNGVYRFLRTDLARGKSGGLESSHTD